MLVVTAVLAVTGPNIEKHTPNLKVWKYQCNEKVITSLRINKSKPKSKLESLHCLLFSACHVVTMVKRDAVTPSPALSSKLAQQALQPHSLRDEVVGGIV